MADFKPGIWQKFIDVRDFIIRNYTPYDGDETFLAPADRAHRKALGKVKALMEEERRRGGVYDIDTLTISDIDAYPPGYIDKELEQIVGLQTDRPLVRAIIPFGGIRMVPHLLRGIQQGDRPHNRDGVQIQEDP